MHLWRITTLMTLLLLAAPAARAQQTPLAGLDDYVATAMKNWGVPGVAIAVIKNDRIVLAKGYGVRELGKPEPVDERTIFAIGSSSKAFTAAAIAMLVDDRVHVGVATQASCGRNRDRGPVVEFADAVGV